MTAQMTWSEQLAAADNRLSEAVRTELYRRIPPQQLWESMQINRGAAERQIVRLVQEILSGWGTYLSQSERRELEAG